MNERRKIDLRSQHAGDQQNSTGFRMLAVEQAEP